MKIKKVITQKTSLPSESTTPDLVVGNLYIDLHQNEIFKFLKISENTYTFSEIDFDLKTVIYKNYTMSSRDLSEKIKNSRFIELTNEMQKRILNPTESYLQIEQLIKEDNEENDVPSKCEALISQGQSNMVHILKTEMESKKREVEIYRALLKSKLHALNQIVYEFEEKLKKIRKVIGVFEVFLGINEEIIQIQEGANASKDDKLHIHQMVYFMDEEIGDPTDGGLDHSRLKEFDDWLTENENYKKLCPHEKSIIVIKPRRYKKDYADIDYMTRSFFDQYDKKTYWLMRNGENLYRIISDMEVNSTRVFPQRDYKISSKQHSFDWEKQNPNVICEDDVFTYKKIAVFLQGVVQRTPIFEFDSKINPTENSGIVFVYDVDDHKLPNGRLPWINWKKQINDKIRLGTRIIFVNDGNQRYEEWKYRGWKSYEKPISGIYNIRRLRYEGQFKSIDIYTRKEELATDVKELNESLYITINPGDSVWNYDHYEGMHLHKRKKAISLQISRNDNFVLNYDEISVDDIDYYLNNRIDRANYLQMIPSLIEARKQKLKEMELEKDFTDLVKTRNIDINEESIQKAIEWWKKKVVFKRPIMSDDSKALRMIESKIKKVKFEEEDE